MAKPLINITRQHAMLFAVFLVLYELLTYVANDMIMPGMIHVVAAFHAPESAIATSLSAYVLGGASLQLILGPLSDCYGRRPVMLIGAIVFLIFTFLIACSLSIQQFLWLRFFEGMGLCFISVIGYATIQEIFAEMDAVRLIAVMANVSILAPLLGPLLGAILMHIMSWRLIFLIIGGISFIALWGLWLSMPESVGVPRHDGQENKRTPFSLRIIMKNYLMLVQDSSFMLGLLAYGLISVPCVAWIGLSPALLITDAKLSLIQYGLWQLPLFGASILGNILLRHLSYERSLKKLVALGSMMTVLSLLSVWILSVLMGPHYIWLMPGLICYFFALGVTSGPLDRFILYATEVSKGTTSALISMMVMVIVAVGIEIANYLYRTHDNQLFALFCAAIGIIYFIVINGAFFWKKYSTKFIAITE